jgi:hypothetical protein
MSKKTCLIVAAFLAFTASAAAQTPSTTPPAGVSVPDLVAAQCPKFTSQIVDRAELKTILSQRPVDISVVCTCTQRSFVADARLQKALNVDDAVLIERMQDERMRGYLTVRLMASVLACLTPELERALAAASPVK